MCGIDGDEVGRVMATADAAKRWYLPNMALCWRTLMGGTPA
jgi:hypothetical protein